MRFADRIAYLNHDIDDAVRAGVLSLNDIPDELIHILGNTTSTRINKMVLSLVENSVGAEIKMDEVVGSAYLQLHKFMFEHVYRNPNAKGEETKVPNLIKILYEYVLNKENLPYDMQEVAEKDGVDRAACDYIAGMTDHFAVALFQEITIPKSWSV